MKFLKVKILAMVGFLAIGFGSINGAVDTSPTGLMKETELLSSVIEKTTDKDQRAALQAILNGFLNLGLRVDALENPTKYRQSRSSGGELQVVQ
jgi:hypothetical protein